ncbi:MAG: glycine zipper 2TM domain-containing protein [Proteobacteria bacterium]|jgi:osmotically inducible lipoprotein OsmB|nr:glycine zipper 2TM domain-containing protein [Pseudomonadota bacterium]
MSAARLKNRARNRAICLLVAPALLTACGTSPTRQQIGTATGAVVGGVVGAVVTGGSTVGTVAGAAAGGVIGAEVTRDGERRR